VNSPAIKEWLGRAVGKEDEDLSRHDKWLCMMYPRLTLLRELLREDGVIFVQIGDEEAAYLRLLLDEIFGAANYRNSIIVRRGTKNVQSQFSTIDSLAVGHDTIFLYTKSPATRLPKMQHNLSEIEAGKWDTFWRGTDRPTMRYELLGITPETGQWRWSQERTQRAVVNYAQYLERYADKMTLDEYYESMLTSTGEKLDFARLGPSQTVQYYVSPRSYKIMNDVWMDVRTRGTVAGFTTEKHIELLQRIIKWVTSLAKNDIVLDSFAGSGTTGHAVLQQNWEDGGNRRFILIEMETSICRNTTFERMKKVTEENMKQLDGLRSGFSYYEIGEPLFDNRGQIRKEITFADLGRYIFFTETGQPMPLPPPSTGGPMGCPSLPPAGGGGPNGRPPFLGSANGVGVYLLYDGISGDGNVLTRSVLDSLPRYDGAKVIYGESCLLSPEWLKRRGVTFRQIPYDVRLV